MMQFRTELTPARAHFTIHHGQPILSMGSCFADLMGRRLQQNKFTCLVNPFGTVFNPLSLAKLLQSALNEKNNISSDLFASHSGSWFHHDFHSSLTAESREALEQKLAALSNQVRLFLRKTEVLILTLGTVVVYELKEKKELVSNCHKQASDLFHKRLLTLDEINTSLEDLLRTLTGKNPDLKVILTVSPVRHTKDGLSLNFLSKSLLRVLCYQMEEKYPNAMYFPAYELLMDDLRDYRFYQADMIHPNEMAVQYIWEKFAGTFFDEPTLSILSHWEKIRKALQHRAFQPGSASHLDFLKQLLGKVKTFERYFDVKDEIAILEEKINVAAEKKN